MKKDIKIGDAIHNVIKVIAPRIAEAKKNCTKCNKRREFLNKIGSRK